MPIVDVEVVGGGEGASSGVAVSARALADALGQVFASPAGRTWVRLHNLDGADYAENEVALSESDWPVFVTVQHAHPPAGSALASELDTVTQVVARCVARAPERVHVQYAAAGQGRMAFGGRVVE